MVELKVLKVRMESGKQAKARRGEYRYLLPCGYVYDADGHPVKDPDLRVQEAITFLFAKFREFGCIRQLHQWIVDERIEMPVRRWSAGKMKTGWYVPRLNWVTSVLKSAFYAGAYVYGRRPIEVVIVDGKIVKRRARARAPEDATVFIPNHHEAYLDWATFEEHQRMISDNRPRNMSNESRTAARDGAALLVGLLRCGHCGRKFYVHYWNSRTTPRYICNGEYESGGGQCVACGGAGVEHAVIERILQVVSRIGVDASLLAIDDLNRDKSDVSRY